jgi:beta-phosphoglucomutase-like phosphatase (HAD superfamily)
MLGLPDAIQACLFNLDGVLTKTTELHAAAWREMFDAFLRERAGRIGTPFEPFDPETRRRSPHGRRRRLRGIGMM